MRVNHELCQGTMHPGNGALQHHETGTRQFGGQFKIHTRCDAGQFVMFRWLEIHFARGAPAMDFDIVVFVFANRHILKRQIRNSPQQGGQFGVQVLGLGLHCGDFGFLVGYQCAQALEFFLVALGLGGPDQLAGLVLFGLRGFGGVDFGPARFVQRQNR